VKSIRLNFDKRSILWAAGMSAITVAFLVLATGAQIQRINDLQSQIVDEREELTINQNSPESIASLQNEVRQLLKTTANYEERVPVESDLGALLQKLAWFAQSRNLRLESVKPGDPATFSEVTALPIRMQVRGPFPAVYAMVKDIEQMTRLTQVDRLEVTKETDEAGIVTAEFTFKVFSRAS